MRIVSLCPSLTELLFDLGVGDELVGRTKFCIHPADRVSVVEKVGGTKNPKVGRIVELEPDLVFMNEEENRVEDARALAAAGLAIHTSLPRTPEETAAMVRSIAGAVNRAAEGERIASDIEIRATRVRRGAGDRPPVTYAYLIWREPLMTINDDTFVAALLGLAGGRNAFGHHAERYPAISVGELREADPDLVLLSTEPFPFREQHADDFARSSGLDRSRFRVVDGELLSWHGSRTPRGIDYAEEVIAGRDGTVAVDGNDAVVAEPGAAEDDPGAQRR